VDFHHPDNIVYFAMMNFASWVIRGAFAFLRVQPHPEREENMSKFQNAFLQRRELTQKLTVSAILIAVAVAIAYISSLVNFFNMPTGGSFTIASTLPIIIIAYMYGAKWGFLSAFVFAVLEILISWGSVARIFTPGDSRFQPLLIAISIILLDYIFAYTILGTAAFARRAQKKSIALAGGAAIALSLRYLMHIISGALFFGAHADWLLTEAMIEMYPVAAISVIYSILYNGIYMIPEIIITVIAAIGVAHIKEIRHMDV